MSEPPADGRAREEFLAEAQELVVGLSRDLLLLDEHQKSGESQPDLLNDLFRGFHTLKGLAGLFGFEVIGRLAHLLEDLLEDLRLGRVEMTQHTLDVLFEGVSAFSRLLVGAKTGEPAQIDLEAFGNAVHTVVAAERSEHDVLRDYDLDPGMLSVLTEYEEHRLRSNLERGLTIYRLRIRLALDMIDSALDTIKQRCKNVAEIITYLPSMDGAGGDAIDIEMMLASVADESTLSAVLEKPASAFEAIGRRLASLPPLAPQRASLFLEPKTPPDQKARESAEVAQGKSPPKSAEPPPPPERAEPVKGPKYAEGSLRSLSSVVRVDIRKLDHLMNVVGELGTVRSQIGRLVEELRSGMRDVHQLAADTHRIHRTFNRFLTEVQDGVLDIRMVPLSQLFDKMAVIVRQVTRELKKDVRLHVVGAETEVDKLIAEELADPLMHIVRNAIDHGIETPQERESISKPTRATVAIMAYHKGNHVVIDVSDDGQGIDTAQVRESAIRKGLLSERAVDDLTRDELLQVIFLPGFSTAKKVTDLSGRGVGMDVVKTNINRLGGAVDLSSEIGRGTTVTITLPITLAIINALLFEVQGRTMSIPLASVQEALRLEMGDLKTIEGREVLSLRGETLPLCRLASLFRLGEPRRGLGGFVIVVVVGHRRVGLVVDRLAGQQDIVIKGLGSSLSQVPGISGATDLGDGCLVLVVDAASILDEVLSLRSNQLRMGGAP